MSKICTKLFEQELTRRGISFAHEITSGSYVIERTDGTRLLISIDNLCLEVDRDHDESRIATFIDAVMSSEEPQHEWEQVASMIYLALEPGDHVEPPELASTISKEVDRVPVIFDEDRGTISWVTSAMLEEWDISPDMLIAKAGENLDQALQKAELEVSDIDGVKLAFLSSELPFNASLILAPGFRAFAEPVLGWPLLAVIPARDFLYVWNAEHLIGRLGEIVVKELKSSPYPLSTEIFELSDAGLQAIGAFPVDE
jgi:hypothetical protein